MKIQNKGDGNEFWEEGLSKSILGEDAKPPEQKVSKKGKLKDVSEFESSLIFLFNINFLMQQLQGVRIKDVTILGIDPSINGCGLVVLDYKGDILERHTVEFKPKNQDTTIDKLNVIFHKIKEIINIYNPRIIVQEDVNARSSFDALKKISYVSGTLKLAVSECYDYKDRPVIFAYPSTKLKLLFAGNGKAEKKEIIECHLNNYGVDFGKDDDQADAFSCARLGKALLDIMVAFKERKAELAESNIFIPEDVSLFDDTTFKYINSFMNSSASFCDFPQEHTGCMFKLKEVDLLIETNGHKYKEILAKSKETNKIIAKKNAT